MKGLDVGEILYDLRKKNHYSQEAVCTGICSVSNYSKYESAEKIPDVFTFTFLCGRTGFPMWGMTAYICRADADYWMWKQKTYRLIQTADYTTLRSHYPYHGKRPFLNRRLMEQFDWYIQGILAEKADGDLKRANECYMQAVKITCPDLLRQERIPEGLYGKTELGLAVMYFHTLILLDEANQSYVAERAHRLLLYVSQSSWDDENKCGIYAALAVLWCRCSADGADTEEKLYHLQNAVSLMRKCSETYCIVALYRQLINVRKELGMGTEQEEENQSIFTELFEEFQIPYQDIFDLVYDDVIMIQTINSYIKKARKFENKSQETVSDGICAVESYSRIENGRHLNKNHYKAIAGKLKIEERYYYDLIKTSKAKAVYVRKEFNQAFNGKQYELCSRKLRELQELLGNGEKPKLRHIKLSQTIIINSSFYEKLNSISVAREFDGVMKRKIMHSLIAEIIQNEIKRTCCKRLEDVYQFENSVSRYKLEDRKDTIISYCKYDILSFYRTGMLEKNDTYIAVSGMDKGVSLRPVHITEEVKDIFPVNNRREEEHILCLNKPQLLWATGTSCVRRTFSKCSLQTRSTVLEIPSTPSRSHGWFTS